MPICLEKKIVRVGDLVRINEQGFRRLAWQADSTIGTVFSEHVNNPKGVLWKERIVWVYWPGGPRKGTSPISTRWLEVVNEN